MPSVDQVFAWLLSLPQGALYAAAFAFAFIENVFPPSPSDVLIALCSFIAAAGHASMAATLASVLVGNIGGAAVMYAVGRRYGAAELHRRMEARGLIRKEERFEKLYARYGLAALFVGRLIPGVRGLVPMIAGAFRVGAVAAMVTISVASAMWYGTLTWLVFRVGENWQVYVEYVGAVGRWGTVVGVVLALVGGVVAYRFLKRRTDRG